MNIGKEKTNEFINSIENLLVSIDDSRMVSDPAGNYNEKDYLGRLVKNARELVFYGEWLIALENAVDNLCGINYKLDTDILDLAESALLSAGCKDLRLGNVQLMKLQDDMPGFKKFLEQGLCMAHDGLLRRVHFDYNKILNSSDVEVSVDSDYGWVNIGFQFRDVVEFCFRQRRNYTDVVLSAGIRADKIDDLFFFDFSPYADCPVVAEDYRRSTCYVGCRKFSLYYKKYEENE